MLYLIVALFAGAAVLGLIVATAILSKKPETPKGVVFGHGVFAATGLGLLIYYSVSNPGNYPQASLIIFIIAALGGFTLAYNDFIRKKAGPAGLVIIHALAAVTAFILLLAFVFF
jgi:hypothetical protein